MRIPDLDDEARRQFTPEDQAMMEAGLCHYNELTSEGVAAFGVVITPILRDYIFKMLAISQHYREPL